MLKAGKIARLTLGLLLLIFGINGFTGFMGERVLPEPALYAFGLVNDLSFLIPFLSVTAILTGIMLLADLLIPVAVSLALAQIAGVITFHLIYYPKGIMFAVLGFVAAVVVIYDYKKSFKRILRRDDSGEKTS